MMHLPSGKGYDFSEVEMLNLMEGHKPPSTDKAQRGAYRTVWLSRMADAYGSGFDAAVLLAGWAAIEWHDLYFEV